MFLVHAIVAVITVAPPAPTSADPVTIRLANSFGAEASVRSASISRTGNTFLIQQDVLFGCFIPSDPEVRSQFAVGTLAPGTYEIIATITFTPGIPGCEVPPITQTATFAVADHIAVPAFSEAMLWVLTAALVVAAVLSLHVPRASR